MTRILYAVNGEGMGHTTRSIAIIDELKKRHEIRIIASTEKSYDVLRKRYKDVHLVYGPRLAYKDNAVDDLGTVKDNFSILLRKAPSNVKTLYKIIKSFGPQIILTDFESATLYVSELFHIPVVCICNNHAVTEFKYKVPRKYKRDYYLTSFITEMLTPNIDHHLITSFFTLPKKEKNVEIFPPVLRSEIARLKPQRKPYILIYQTSSTNKRLIDEIKSINYKFIAYGFDREGRDGNVTFKGFDAKRFLVDLKDCNACIANGGYTFVSEAIALHKPVLSIPIKGQFEQILNALQIERLGYGEIHDSVNKKIIERFIKQSDNYHKKMKHIKIEGNDRLIKRIEAIIDEYRHDS